MGDWGWGTGCEAQERLAGRSWRQAWRKNPIKRRDQARGPNLAKVEARSHQEVQAGRAFSGLKDELGGETKLAVSPLREEARPPRQRSSWQEDLSLA